MKITWSHNKYVDTTRFKNKKNLKHFINTKGKWLCKLSEKGIFTSIHNYFWLNFVIISWFGLHESFCSSKPCSFTSKHEWWHSKSHVSASQSLWFIRKCFQARKTPFSKFMHICNHCAQRISFSFARVFLSEPWQELIVSLCALV